MSSTAHIISAILLLILITVMFGGFHSCGCCATGYRETRSRTSAPDTLMLASW
jgi:hypothetical protein